MKIRFLIAAALASVIAFSSCKKDDPAPTGNNTPIPTPSPAKRLKKLTETESGVTTVYNLSYNASGKLISYKNADNTKYVLFSYDAQGNLTGIEEQEEDYKNIYTYQYQDNKPVTGSLKSWELVNGQPGQLIEDDLLTYTVTNNQVSDIHLEMLQSALEIDLHLTYAGGNLAGIASTGQFSYTADFTFGTHKSALPKVTNWVLDQAGFSLQFASNNEILSATFDFPGTASDYSMQTQYTYDSNGYVLTSIGDGTQSVFEYE